MSKPLGSITLAAILAVAALLPWRPAVDQAQAVAVAPAAAVDNPAPWRTGDPTFSAPTGKPSRVGVTYRGMWADITDAQRASMLDKFAAAGVRWIRLDVAWKTLQPTGPNSYDLAWGVPFLEKRLNEIAARGMKTMVLFHWAPEWSSGTSNINGVPRDPHEFGRAAAWMAKRFAGKLHAIELWNEPNLSHFLANKSVVTYTNLLKAAYPKIKAANPAVTVVAGSPTGINTPWYRQMYANGGAHMFDALGIHPYMGNTDEPPTKCDTRYIIYYPCGIADLVKLMKDHGDGNRQIWATEYGWSTHDNSTYTKPYNSWERGVTYANQAKYLIQMQQVLAQYPQVGASFWHTDRNPANSDAQQANFGLLHRNFAPKPSYYAMKCVNTRICGPSTTTTTTPTTKTFVAAGSVWNVDDSGVQRSTGWRSTTFDDSSWRRAAAQLGYGDGDERSVLDADGTTGQEPITYYARKSFDAGSSVDTGGSLTLRGIVDDGAVVYLNGTEIWRHNLPSGTITATTPAVTATAGSAESTWRSATVPASALRTGKNVIAVEVHNASRASSDISLDLSLAR